MVSDELRRQADQFVDLADLEEQICRVQSDNYSREGGGRGQSGGSFSPANSDDFADV
jgi:hypothetical protein